MRPSFINRYSICSNPEKMGDRIKKRQWERNLVRRGEIK